jgi:phosphatidylglycerophosphate synthase
MLDNRVRAAFDPPLQRVAAWMAGWRLPADAITVAGLAVGVGACVAAGDERWWLALALWCANRGLDGLDGAVARRTAATDAGGFLDVVADFTVYGGFVLGVAVARPEARLACAALLLAYYLNGTAFLALSSLAERRRQQLGDERSLRFVAGLTESTETFVAYVVFCLFPSAAAAIAWTFAAAVAFTAGQRVVWGVRLLRVPASD